MLGFDELTPALKRTWHPRLAPLGFQRVGRRDLLSLSNGIVRLFNFQLSSWGSRIFCVNVAAFTLCGHDAPVLMPGFRLRHPDHRSMWLPSRSAAAATKSAEIAWEAAESQALPWFELNSTLEGHLQVLQTETWGARHHLHFQIGVVEAMLGRGEEARRDLVEASRLYARERHEWCGNYIAKVDALVAAIERGSASDLLKEWEVANRPVHGLGLD